MYHEELCRRIFWEFCLFYDYEFFSSRLFLKEIADGLQLIADGKAKTLSVSMPPRSGKSYIASLFCAWWLGKNPDKSVMRNSCTATLFRKFSYDVRAIVKEQKYQQVFPAIALSADKQNIDGWNLVQSKQVGYFGSGVGGTIIGFGANLAISDDLFKDIADALSEVTNDKAHVWKQSAHNSRMEKDCPEIYIGTRWSKNDIIGKAIEDGNIEIQIKVSALTPEGKSFCENVKSTDEYLKIKKDTDEEIWDAEYMQDPAELKGLLFPKSSLKFYRPADVDLSKAEYKFAYVDPADEGGDFNASPFCYLIGDRIYIPYARFNTDGTDVNIPDLVEEFCMQKLDSAEVEGNTAWILFGKDLRAKVNDRHPDCEIRIIKNTTNKQTRILAQSAFIKNHCYFPEDYDQHNQYRAFIRNLTRYMRHGDNSHDDAPDALAGCAQHFKTRFAHLW